MSFTSAAIVYCICFPSISASRGKKHSASLSINRRHQRRDTGRGECGGGGKRPLASRLKPHRGQEAERTESKVRRVPHTPQKRKSRACQNAMAVACSVARFQPPRRRRLENTLPATEPGAASYRVFRGPNVGPMGLPDLEVPRDIMPSLYASRSSLLFMAGSDELN